MFFQFGCQLQNIPDALKFRFPKKAIKIWRNSFDISFTICQLKTKRKIAPNSCGLLSTF